MTNTDRPLTIFLSAAEASGDEHAARLIAALRRKLPGARIVGVAGEKMAAEGCEVLEDMTVHASMLGGPLKKLGYYYRTVKRLQQDIRRIRPDVFVPVDSPALNWHLAAAAREAGSPVVYYICPQVWAWAPWRIRKLARLTDHVACILPFEEPYLRHRGVNATYVGHPLLESLAPRPDPMPDLVEAWAHGKWKVALLPGSRRGEIQAHTQALLQAAGKIIRRWPEARCVLTARNLAAARQIRAAIGRIPPIHVEVAVGQTREVLAQSHFALAVSGTVTLEVAYFGVPMIIIYRTGRLLRWMHKLLGRWAVPTPHLSLVNILAGRRIAPEVMPWNGKFRPIEKILDEVMDEMGWLVEARKDLIQTVESLRTPGPGASETAADLIIQTIQSRRASNRS